MRPVSVRGFVEQLAYDARSQDAMVTPRDESRFIALLGTATLHTWADLPQDVQQAIFEHAVVHGHRDERDERDESLREQLAKFLHDRHARTQQAEG